MELKYKGFIAKICFSPEVGSFYGEILNSDDLITFQAASLDEAKAMVGESIEHYLAYMALLEEAL